MSQVVHVFYIIGIFGSDGKESRFADAGKLLAIIAICVAAVPILNLFFLWYALVPLIVGTFALVKKEPAKGKAILAVLSPIISFVITVVVTILTALIISLVSTISLMSAYEAATAPTWEDSVDVSIGSFEMNTKDGDTETALTVQVENISRETKDIVVKIEAVDKNGDRIDTDTLRISDLKAGQRKEYKMFTDVSDKNVYEMKSAKFHIVEVTVK